MNLQLGKTKEDLKKIVCKTKALCVFSGHWILAIISFLLLIWLAFFWYSYVAKPDWSYEQKQEYAKSKQNEAIFDQKKFDAVIGEIEERRSEYGKNIENIPNIFGL